MPDPLSPLAAEYVAEFEASGPQLVPPGSAAATASSAMPKLNVSLSPWLLGGAALLGLAVLLSGD